MLPIFLLLLFGLLASIAVGAAFTAWKMTHPPRRTYASAVAAGKPGDPSELDRPRPFETRRIDTPHGEVEAWLIEGHAPHGPVILFAHGWASSKLSALPRVDTFARHARRLVAIDLPGHGDSTGWSALGGLEPETIDAIATQLLVPPSELVLAGSSMGATSALAGAAHIESRERAPVAGLILEGIYRDAWTPLWRTLERDGKPWRIIGRLALALVNVSARRSLSRHRFDRVHAARQVSAPILFIHADEDEIAPLDGARAVADAARQGSVHVISGAAHHELWMPEHATDTAQAIDTFLGALTTPSSPAPGSTTRAEGERADPEQGSRTGGRDEEEPTAART
ncbi:MAG: alpha/beta fold hydrolase [Planctomycetota bacterium]